MNKLIPLKIPLLNANEDEVVLASLYVTDQQRINQGDLLAVVESTKTTAEILAERDGFIVGLMAKEGMSFKNGQVWAYLSDDENAFDPDLTPWSVQSAANKNNTLEGLRITKPAQALIKKHGIESCKLPTDQIITTDVVQALIDHKKADKVNWVDRPANDNKRILIYGAGGHGRTLLELIRLLPGYKVEGFIDDGLPVGKFMLGLPVLGGKDKLGQLFADGVTLAVNGVGGIGNFQQRLDAYLALRDAGFYCQTVVHPFAYMEASAKMEAGVQIFPFAYVGSLVKVGYGVIINTAAVVSHDCVLGELSNLSPGATLAGGVEIGPRTLVGMRATINLGVRVGADARIGNGATVKADVPERGIVPAGSVWPPRK